MSKPSAPTPPNPQQTAAGATSTNVGTAVANAMLNNVNQITPQGSLNYSQTGSYNWYDPYTGTTMNLPEFTATQTLSPEYQAIQSQIDASKYNMAGLANQASGNLAQLMSNNIDLSQAPAAGNVGSLTSMPMAPTQIDTSGLANAGNIQSNYSDPSQFQGQANQLTQSVMARAQPQLQQQLDQLRQQLASQGIQYGSTAYNNAMATYNNQVNNLQLGAIQTGDTEQQQLNQMAAQQAAFGNAAQSQAFQQAAAQGQFTNAGVAQDYAQQQQNVSAENQARQQALNEAYAQRNQPINEVSALLSGSQINNPNFVNTPSNQIPTTDVAGIINSNFNQQMQVYQQQSQNWNTLMGGLFGMAGGMMKMGMMSDRRVKEDIVPMGSIWRESGNDRGSFDDAYGDRDFELPIYAYSYKQDPTHARHIGPMAQDVERIDPRAVFEVDGVKHIDVPHALGSVLGTGEVHYGRRH